MAVSATLDTDPTQWRIVVVRLMADGSASDELTTIFVEERPQDNVSCFEWSPSGDSFAYTALLGSDGVFTIATPGLFYSPIGTGRDFPPPIPDYARWKPDGTAVAFVSAANPHGDGTDMYSMIDLAFVDASAAHPLLRTDPNEIINDIAWSPDGTAIAYRGTRFVPGAGSAGSFVRVLTVGAGNVERLQLDELNDHQSASDAGPAWSPDGSQLAWALGGELRVGAPDGSGWRGLPPVSSDALGTGWATDPVIWSADGSQLLVGQLSQSPLVRDPESSVVVYDVTGEGQPTGVLPWRLGGYGRLSWQVVSN